MKRIIFEGPDGCGKTTLSQIISDIYNIPVYTSPHRHKIDKNETLLLNILKWGIPEQLQLIQTCDSKIIYDRFFPSEFVYSSVYKRKTDKNLIFKYDKWWNDLDGVIIFLDKPCMEVNDHLVEKKYYQQIRKKYQEYKELTVCPHITIDSTSESVQEQLTQILKLLKDNN
jgi:thymidylate kinase|tara:strand:- start:7351 stop:7860 length:510 start_codon:yes stop_codon:yes gene_type:complete